MPAKSIFNAHRKPKFGDLILAAHKGDADVVKDLLKRGANPNEESFEFFFPLGAAAEQGHVEVARLLIENGADVNKKASDTALTFAAGKGQAEVVRLLIDKGADIYETGMAQLDAQDLARILGFEKIEQMLKDANESRQQLLAVEKASAAAAAQAAETARVEYVSDPRLHRDIPKPKLLRVPASAVQQ